MSEPRDALFLSRLWEALDGAASTLDAVSFEGAAGALASVYAVSEAAAAQVAAATLAVAELRAARTESEVPRVRVDRGHVEAAFRSERHLRAIGWQLPSSGGESVEGDHEARDGWIRLHASFSWHREAALAVLGAPERRAAVAAAIRAWEVDALERAVVERGGAAAKMRTPAEWKRHAQGEAVAGEPLVHVTCVRAPRRALPAAATPLGGVRALDLTRVIAGPVCSRVLAAYGADVLRIDPLGFTDAGGLIADTTAGKRRASLDLRAPRDRVVFEELVSGAHVLVGGYRAGALERLGYSSGALRDLNPALLLASIDAYGWTGPWRERRGFDSLVQMSCGIAARGAEGAGLVRPVPLPAQALDHGTGYLLAAAVCRALTRQIARGDASEVRVSLARTARWLMDLGDDGDVPRPDVSPPDAAAWLERVQTAWGPLDRVSCPGSIEGVPSRWTLPPGPLGTDTPAW